MNKSYFLIINILCSIILLMTGCANSTTSDRHPLTNVRPTLISPGMQIVQLGNRVNIYISSDRCFEAGTSNIKENYQPNLDNLVAVLKSYGSTPMTISAYTDNVLPARQAQLLSRAQADSLISYLWAHGIPYQQLYAVGKGQECPIAQNDTVTGSAMNRRIEISLWAP
jgi:outer membrane protein OmpA-like peptidoglycan-associated protein